MNNKHFLPYQQRWLEDKSKIKIAEKSRRIGLTYAQSYEDVEDIVKKRVPEVWFSSADETAAKEYIEYCAIWAKYFNAATSFIGEELLDENKDIQVSTIRFKNGSKIVALSSNPKGFRSKGGKIVLDEFAYHEHADMLWKAARPCITWGFPLRIISTHNGQNCKYYQFVNDIKKGNLNWSLHTTPIHLAVKEGLLDKIRELQGLPKPTAKEKADWLEQEQKDCHDENTWLQEYCCVPIDETTAFLTYDLITGCEKDNILRSLEQIEGDLYVGFDVGRKKDLSVIWILEKLGHIKYTVAVIVMEKTPFRLQKEQLFKILEHPKLMRACIDSTGLGMQMAEEAQDFFGKYRVEAVSFTAKVKEEIAYSLKTEFEDKTTYIPSDRKIREDLHSVKKITTSANNIRFDVDNTTDGHADRFWALGLAVHADSKNLGPIIISSRKVRRDSNITNGY